MQRATRTFGRVTRDLTMDPKSLSQEEREAHDIFELGDFLLQSGRTIRSAKLAFKVWGKLNADKSNAILYPTWYSGKHWDNDWLIGPGMGLDPSKYCIIVPNMFGNGLSSSPSNTPPPANAARFPEIRVQDNVRAQYRLVTEKFGIKKLVMVIGWSMGAGQTFQWGVSYPDMMDRLLPFCGSARTSDHNKVFLDGLAATMKADADFRGGWYDPQKPPTLGPRAFARVYAGWGLSQPFYWKQEWRKLGFTSLEDFLIDFWEALFLAPKDPNDLLGMIWTWQNGDVGATPGFHGNHVKALTSIKAKALVMPAEQDLYFPVADEVSHMTNAELRVIPGIWGHFAGGGANPDDTNFIDDAVKELLATPVHKKPSTSDSMASMSISA